MISFDDALNLIEAHVAPLGTEVVELGEASGAF